MSYPSRYNHLVRTTMADGRDVRIVTNLLFGASDMVDETIYNALLEGENTGRVTTGRLPPETHDYLLSRRMLWSDPHDEEVLVGKLGDSYGGRDKIAAGLGGGQYGFITSLYCNLDCPYCFQKEHADSCGFLTKRQVDLGIAAIGKAEESVVALSGGKPTLPKISITGGEPMLPNKTNTETLDYLVERLNELGWPYNITTNGTELANYINRHDSSPRCRNVQVTLDGPPEIHDSRRHFRGGAPSFAQIMNGVDLGLKAGLKITLRVNLDMSNVEGLPKLAAIVKERKWNDYEAFHAYVSPVTDHGSIGGDEVPRNEADLLESLLSVTEGHPEILDIFSIKHFRGFNYVERIVVEKNPRYPVVMRCEAVTGMYIFDPLGNVSVCLETVGDERRRVGRYDPEWRLDERALSGWADRNVLELDGCDNCKIRFVCAGGCALESMNKDDGEYCMPFLREMNIAWNYFARTRPELFEDDAA